MTGLYLIAFLPVIIGLIFWVKSKTIIWQEWVLGSVVSFILAGVIHLIAVNATTTDLETWSGRIIGC